MEHIFLASPDHLPIEHAVRKAELVAMGAPAGILKAVMATRLAADLHHGDFWRTVWIFLIEHARHVDSSTQIGPMIDYIEAIRHEQNIGGDTRWHGDIRSASAATKFLRMKGRTMQSMMRLMAGLASEPKGKAALEFSLDAVAIQAFAV